MLRPLSRQQRRRQRQYRSAIDPTEWPLDYDAAQRMIVVDALPKGWRDLINEHGLTPVLQALEETKSVKLATKFMRERRDRRQMQIAMGNF